MIEKLKEKLSLDELKEMVSDVNCWNGQLDDLYYYENDEYFFKDFFGHKVDDAIRAGCSELEYEEEIEDSAEEIIEAYLDNIDNMYDDDLKKKIKSILQGEDK